MANTATRTYTFTGQSNTYTENKTVTIPIENFTVTGDTTQTPSSVESFTVSHYHSCSGGSRYVWQLYVEILFENGNTRQSDTVGHSCNGTVVKWTNTFSTITGEDLQSGIKTVSIKIANAPSSGKPYLYWRAITGNPITITTTFNTHVAVAPVIDESATGISSNADYVGFYNAYTVPVFSHSVSYDEEAEAKAKSKVLAIQVYDVNNNSLTIQGITGNHTISTMGSYSLPAITYAVSSAFPLKVSWTFTVTDTNNLSDSFSGSFVVLYYSPPLTGLSVDRWEEDLYGTITLGKGDHAYMSLLVTGISKVGEYVISHAWVDSSGVIQPVSSSAIGGNNDYDMIVYKVTPGETISEITTDPITVVYASYVDSPTIGSVSYNNSRHSSSYNTLTDQTVPSGVNWIAVRKKAGTDITFTYSGRTQNAASVTLYVQQEGNSQKTVLNVPGGTGILPGSALSIAENPKSSSFTPIDSGTRYTSTSYVYTLTVRDLISTSVDTANLAVSTVLFNVEKTGVGIGKYSSRGTASNPLLEVAMDADFTGVAMFNGYGLNGVTNNVNTYFFTRNNIHGSFLLYDPLTNPDYAVRVTRLGPFVFLQGKIIVAYPATIPVDVYNVGGISGDDDVAIINYMPVWAVPYGPQMFGKLMSTETTSSGANQHLPYQIEVHPIRENNVWSAKIYFRWPIYSDTILTNTSFRLTACWIARDVFE